MKKILKIIYNLIPFKFFFFSLIKKIFKIKNRNIYQHLHFKGYFRTCYLGREFHVYSLPTIIENEIFWNGLGKNWEPLSTKVWCFLIKNLDHSHNIVFDIGANTGIYSTLACSFNKNIKVFAFEPNAHFLSAIKKSKNKNNHNIVLNNIALSSSNKLLNFDGYQIKKEQSIFTVEALRMDQYIKSNNINHIDLIKLDVEHHEPDVLEGMGSYLKEFKPDFLIEVLNDETAMKLKKFFDKIDYNYVSIDDKNNTLRVINEIKKSDYYNILVCKNNTYNLVKARFKNNFIYE